MTREQLAEIETVAIAIIINYLCKHPNSEVELDSFNEYLKEMSAPTGF